jgi:hypothetical protein
VPIFAIFTFRKQLVNSFTFLCSLFTIFNIILNIMNKHGYDGRNDTI